MYIQKILNFHFKIICIKFLRETRKNADHEFSNVVVL